jgi:transposase
MSNLLLSIGVLLSMAKQPILIEVQESEQELRRLFRKAAPAIRPRIQMLLAIVTGIPSSDTLTLSRKAKTSDQSIRTWKNIYKQGGSAALLREGRGGSEGAIDQKGKEQIAVRLADAKNCFRSFEQARQWINDTLGLDLDYHAVNKYLVRNFGVKMKAGRKSHVLKSETATADYKKPSREAGTY